MNALTSHLLVDPEDEHGVCHDFLSEAISRFPEDESVQVALVTAVEGLSQRLSKLSMNADYKPYVMVRLNSQSLVNQLKQLGHEKSCAIPCSC